MKSTALGAENIIFISDAHEKFYYEKLQEVRYQDEEISMYGYEGKENWEREQLPDKLSRSSTDERHGDK